MAPHLLDVEVLSVLGGLGHASTIALILVALKVNHCALAEALQPSRRCHLQLREIHAECHRSRKIEGGSKDDEQLQGSHRSCSPKLVDDCE